MKLISQETFDSAVLENIQEFDYSPEDAIKEAVKEFEAQGVQLTNIVQNPTYDSQKNVINHEIIQYLRTVEDFQDSSKDDIETALIKFAEQCKKSLAHRLLASKHNGYKILLSLAKSEKCDKSISLALFALAALTTTNSDILDSEGITVMDNVLSKCASTSDNDLTISVAKWCLECCLKHENNRQSLFKANIPKQLADLLKLQKDRKCVLSVCKTLRAFTLDDDIRVEFGKAHNHVRILVEEYQLVSTITDYMKEYNNDVEVVGELMSTLRTLCVRSEYCQDAVDKGALCIINDIFVSFMDYPDVIRQNLRLMKILSGNDQVKVKVMQSGSASLIVNALLRHKMHAGVCEAGCSAIAMLALRVPNHAKDLVICGSSDAIIQAMKTHPENLPIQKSGCMAIRNLTCRVTENRSVFIECGVEDVIHSAIAAFPKELDFLDIAKAALRDLGLQVYLEEQWKGTGVEINR